MIGGRLGRVRPEVIAALTQTPAVKKQVRKVAGAVRKEARRLAPKDTKVLAKNITVENVLDPATGQVEFHVGWSGSGWYGGQVEFGNEHQPPQPHLVPAALAVKRGEITAGDLDVS